MIEHDTAANHTFSNLTSGVSYKVEVCAIGAAGPSDWSQAATLFAD